MKLVFTVTNDLTYDQRMHRICVTLADAGYDVHLIGFTKKHSAALEKQPFRQTRLRPFFRKGRMFYAEYNIRLFFYLLFAGADLFCAIDLDTLLPAWMVGRLRRKKVCLDAHEFFSQLPEVVTRRGVRRFWTLLERILLPRVKFGYTVSEGIALQFAEKYGVQYEVIPNYPRFNAVKHQQPRPSKEGAILYQGALNKGRGLEALIRAAARLPNYKFIIAGEGDISDALKEYATRIAPAANIDFLGYVPPEKLKQLTSTAWLGVNLLDNCGLSYYYSLSNKFLDYMHAGLPQICIDFPEYRRINDKYHIAQMLPEASEDHIVQAINHISADDAEYNVMRQNCLKAREEVNWESVEPALLAFYEHMFNGSQ